MPNMHKLQKHDKRMMCVCVRAHSSRPRAQHECKNGLLAKKQCASFMHNITRMTINSHDITQFDSK